MTAKLTPLQRVNKEHGGKDKLVDKLMSLLDRGDEPKDEFRARLLAAPNSKLLRLFEVHKAVDEQFGGKEKLVDEILGLMKRTRDKDYRDKLLTYASTRLMDLYRSWRKKARAA